MRGDYIMLINDEHVIVRRRGYLLGELTVMMMNTPVEIVSDISYILELLKKLPFIHRFKYPYVPTKQQVTDINAPKGLPTPSEIRTADRLLRILYGLIANTEVGEAVINFELDPPAKIELSEETKHIYLEQVERYTKMFNELYLLGTDFYVMYNYCREFADKTLTLLERLDSSELSEAYEYITYPHDLFSMKNFKEPLEGEYQPGDSMVLQYIPLIDNSGEYCIAEVFRMDTLQGLLKTDFVRGLMKGHFPRKCGHCGRYFLMTKGYHTKFCDMPSPEDPMRSCRQVEYAKTGIKENKADDPLYQCFQRCAGRLTKAFQRGTISEEEKNTLLRAAEDTYFEAVSSPTYTNVQFEQALSSENLYRLCGIKYKGRGRPRSVRRTKTVKRTENEQSKQRSCAV